MRTLYSQPPLPCHAKYTGVSRAFLSDLSGIKTACAIISKNRDLFSRTQIWRDLPLQNELTSAWMLPTQFTWVREVWNHINKPLWIRRSETVYYMRSDTSLHLGIPSPSRRAWRKGEEGALQITGAISGFTYQYHLRSMAV